jgi:probable poly-beta-1,6-N-acetyl-D-glucosamine export protein
MYQYVTGTAYYHLWFFILIIELYILYPILENVFTKSVNDHKTGFLLIFLLIIQILFQFFSIEKMDLIGNLTIFLGYMFYFVLGMYVRYHYADYKNRAGVLKHSYSIFLALLSATILGIGINYIDYFRNDLIPQIIQLYYWIYAIEIPFYYILIFTVCLYIALKITEMIPDRITRGLEILGKYSFGIYLIEPFILGAVSIVILPRVEFNANNWLFYPVVYTLVLCLSVLFVHGMNKIPYHEYIIGSSR